MVLILLFAGSVTLSFAFPKDSIRKYSLGIEVSAIGTRFFRSEYSEKITIDYFNSSGPVFQFSRFFISPKYQQFSGKIEKNLSEEEKWLSDSDIKFGMALIEGGYDLVNGKRLICSLSAAGGMARATSLLLESGRENVIVKSTYQPFCMMAMGLKWIPISIEVKDAFFDKLEFLMDLKGGYYSDLTPKEFKLRGDSFQLFCNVGWRICW